MHALAGAGHAAGALFPRYDVAPEQPVGAAPDQLERRRAARGPALWKVPLGTALVERLAWLGPDHVYLALRADSAKLENLDHMVLEAATGRTVWRRSREQRDSRYSLLYATPRVLLFSIEHGNGTRELEALDGATGERRWARRLRPPKGLASVLPTLIEAAGLVVVVERSGAAGLELSSGNVAWERSLAGSGPVRPLVSDGTGLWDPNGTVARVSDATGANLWESDVVAADVPLQIDGDRLFVVGPDRRVTGMDATSGDMLWQVRLPVDVAADNVQPADGAVFVRGRDGSGTAGRHVFAMLDPRDGHLRWLQALEEPSLSNVIVAGDTVYHATASETFALDAATGAPRFETRITDTGRNYPVHLRLEDAHVVYIGELVIAGVALEDGSLRFRHGLTPLSPETSLNALDASIPRLREQLGAAKAGGGSFDLGEARRFQNLSNGYARQAQSYRTQAFMARSSGNGGMADSARFRALEAQGAANRAASQARTMATVEMSLSIMNLAMQLQDVWKAAGIESTIERYLLFRDAILGGYAAAENARYVFRPHSRYRAADDHFAGVQIMDLATGRRAFTYLSPAYRSYGLCNLVDFERGIVIHHGVGLDPAGYQYGEAYRPAPLAPRIRTVESYLIASAVRIP